jgi:hypothetical protein
VEKYPPDGCKHADLLLKLPNIKMDIPEKALLFSSSGSRVVVVSSKAYFSEMLASSYASLLLQGVKPGCKAVVAYPWCSWSSLLLAVEALKLLNCKYTYFTEAKGEYDVALGLPSLLIKANARARLVLTDGEPLDEQMRNKIKSVLGADNLYDAFGSSETGIIGIEYCSKGSYILFPHVRLEPTSKGTFVKTPWTEVLLPDFLELREERCCGRRWNAFRVKGLREDYVRTRGGGYVNKRAVSEALKASGGVLITVEEGKEALLRVVAKGPIDVNAFLEELKSRIPVIYLISKEDGVPMLELEINGKVMRF